MTKKQKEKAEQLILKQMLDNNPKLKEVIDNLVELSNPELKDVIAPVIENQLNERKSLILFSQPPSEICQNITNTIGHDLAI